LVGVFFFFWWCVGVCWGGWGWFFSHPITSKWLFPLLISKAAGNFFFALPSLFHGFPTESQSSHFTFFASLSFLQHLFLFPARTIPLIESTTSGWNFEVRQIPNSLSACGLGPGLSPPGPFRCNSMHPSLPGRSSFTTTGTIFFFTTFLVAAHPSFPVFGEMFCVLLPISFILANNYPR